MFALRSRSHPQKEAVARRHRGSYHLPAHYPTRVRGGRSITTEELHAADPSPADAVVKGRRAVSADTALLLDALADTAGQVGPVARTEGPGAATEGPPTAQDGIVSIPSVSSTCALSAIGGGR